MEKLFKPKGPLRLQGYDRLYEKLLLSDVDLGEYRIKQEKIDFPFNIVAKGNAPDSLVMFGYHAFFQGMYQAYADHRSFVLSPDAIWLLVSQGFARHVAANAEAMRHHFVDFEGKVSLVVADDFVHPGSPASDWETIFSEIYRTDR